MASVEPNSSDLGAGWAAMNDGGLAISGDAAVGTSDGYSGDIRTGEDYGSDQYSQIVLSLDPAHAAGSGSARPSAARTAVRTPTWESTSGAPATRSWSSINAPTATGPSSATATRSRHCPPAPC